MKIKTRLFLIVVLVTMLSFAIIFVRYVTTNQINQNSKISQKSEAIVREVFGLNTLLNDYLLYHTKRSQSQWSLQQQKISTLLASQQYTNPDDEAIQKKIITAHHDNMIIFPKLVNAYESGSPKDLQDRLASQLLIGSQSMVTNSILLSTHSSSETEQVRAITRSLINLLVAILVLSVTILFFLLYKSIIDPITKLQEASRQVAAGNWNYKVPVTRNDELGQLAQAFNDMTGKINRYIKQQKQLEKQKDEFIASASHELKTPVTSIKVYAEVLEQRFTKAGDNKSAGLLEKMNRQMNKLTILINDLLDLSKIEKGQLRYQMETFDLNTLIDEISQEMQQISDGSTITKKLAKNTTIYGDRNRIGQVLINLLSNALKYSPQESSVIVSTRRHDGKLELSVQDFGIGIAKKDQERIFKRFFRANGAVGQTYPGLGLGLYISKQIISRHEGKMWVKSSEGKGSTFFVSLPVNDKLLKNN